MYKTMTEGRQQHLQERRDQSGAITDADIFEEDTCKVLILQFNVLSRTVEAVIGYGYVEIIDGITVFNTKRTHTITIQNQPGGGRALFKEFCDSCGGEDLVTPDGILAFISANCGEVPDFLAMKVLAVPFVKGEVSAPLESHALTKT